MMSEAARCAKEIKKILKEKYPDTKFSVTSSYFSMGSSVDVYWSGGPKSEDVDSLIKHFQYGHFDGMDDSYNHSNMRKDIPQVKYVMTQRRRDA